MDKIYLITAIHISSKPIRKNYSLIKRSRAVGWFSTLDRAEEIVLNNEGGIYEGGHYDHCVIEEICSGLYPHVAMEEWFKWTKRKMIDYSGYIIIPKPEELKGFINFSIG